MNNNNRFMSDIPKAKQCPECKHYDSLSQTTHFSGITEIKDKCKEGYAWYSEDNVNCSGFKQKKKRK